jgi:hypothetical protein
MEMTVVALRRYPVKSMGGQPMRTVPVDGRGLNGDRWYAVEDSEGHFASGKNTRRFRRRDAVFRYAAATTMDTEVVVTGRGGVWKVGDPALDVELSLAMGTPVAVTPERDVPHQDMGAVSLISTATLEWCANRWGVDADPRRLRANIVFAAEEPFVEEQWQGKLLVVGQARLRVVERAPRCRMIDIAQDGARNDGRWLKPLAAERDMFLAMYADVEAAGFVSAGDRLRAE